MTKPSSDKPQIDKFKEAAKEVETDNSEVAFDRALRRVSKATTARQDQRARKNPLAD